MGKRSAICPHDSTGKSFEENEYHFIVTCIHKKNTEIKGAF